MTKKRRRKPGQIVKLLQEREAMLSTGKSAAEVSQKLEISEATRVRWKQHNTLIHFPTPYPRDPVPSYRRIKEWGIPQGVREVIHVWRN